MGNLCPIIKNVYATVADVDDESLTRDTNVKDVLNQTKELILELKIQQAETLAIIQKTPDEECIELSKTYFERETLLKFLETSKNTAEKPLANIRINKVVRKLSEVIKKQRDAAKHNKTFSIAVESLAEAAVDVKEDAEERIGAQQEVVANAGGGVIEDEEEREKAMEKIRALKRGPVKARIEVAPSNAESKLADALSAAEVAPPPPPKPLSIRQPVVPPGSSLRVAPVEFA